MDSNGIDLIITYIGLPIFLFISLLFGTSAFQKLGSRAIILTFVLWCASFIQIIGGATVFGFAAQRELLSSVPALVALLATMVSGLICSLGLFLGLLATVFLTTLLEKVLISRTAKKYIIILVGFVVFLSSYSALVLWLGSPADVLAPFSLLIAGGLTKLDYGSIGITFSMIVGTGFANYCF